MNSPSSSDSPSTHWHWPLIALVGGIRFLNLGFEDLQAWDEALYAVRAKGILIFGGWIDQTAFAIDGLYSSLHPPLHVWLTAIVFQLFDPDEFSVRFVAALAGAATLPLIYAIGRRWVNAHVAIYAVLLFGLNPFAMFYSRQGQFDALLVFFLTVSVYFILRSHSSNRWLWPALAGLSVGCALMTKLFVGLGIPLAYLLWLFFTGQVRDRRRQTSILLLLIVAGVVAAPWHVFMTLQHGGGDIFFFLSQSALWERSISGIEGNVKPLEVFYFVNQMVVLFPFGMAWFLASLWEMRIRKDSDGLFLAVWFLVFFVVFSVLRTKLAVYLLPTLVPASLLGGKALWQATEKTITVRRTALLTGATMLFIIWSVSQFWRNAVKEIVAGAVLLQFPSSHSIISASVLLSLVISFVGLVLLFWRMGYLARFVRIVPPLLFLPLGIIAAYHIIIADRFQYVDGATALKQFIDQHKVHRVVVAGYERNPQLSWYLRGADLGWRDDLSVRRIIPPEDSLLYRAWLFDEMQGEPGSTLLLIEKDKFVRYHWIDPSHFIVPEFRPVLDSRRYTGYVRSPADFLAFRSVLKEPSNAFSR